MQEDLKPTCTSWIKDGAKRAKSTRAPVARTKTSKAAAGPVVRPTTTMAAAVDSDSELESDWEDQVGGNQPKLMEEIFSSDGDCPDTMQYLAERAADRKSRRAAMHSRSAKAAVPLPGATAESEDGSVEQVKEQLAQFLFAGSSSEEDPELTPEPETPEDAARNAAITQARRRGEVVNEVRDDGDTSSDDWPVIDSFSAASYARLKF